MKKIFSISIFSFFILGMIIKPASSQNAKIILERVIEAQGGRETLEKIKDITASAEGKFILWDSTGTAISYWKEPNKERLDLEVSGVIITLVFDGKTAWVTNPETGSIEEISGKLAEVVRNTSFGISAFLSPEKYGITYNFRGKENIGGKNYFLLDQVNSGGFTITHYIDPNTYLVFKVKHKNYDEKLNEIEGETIYSDYRLVNDIMIPYSITSTQDGKKTIILTITEVSFNSGLGDSVFEIY